MSEIKLEELDYHFHLRSRMTQRGITREEIEKTLKCGWIADDSKTGTSGKVYVFQYNNEWEGKYFEEKEVSVYYKMISQEVVLLTVKARYGKNFPRSGKQ